jgi:hemolysin activation/secretion protein
LNDVLIEGASAYSAEVLRGLYATLLGQEVSVAQVFEVANAIELRYRKDGYVTSRVLVPEQTVADGRFRIRVLEGHVAGVVFQGEAGPAGAALQSLMAGLTALRPINLAEIERRLLLANDLPGLQVQGSLEASPTAQGGSTLVVRTQRRERERREEARTHGGSPGAADSPQFRGVEARSAHRRDDTPKAARSRPRRDDGG